MDIEKTREVVSKYAVDLAPIVKQQLNMAEQLVSDLIEYSGCSLEEAQKLYMETSAYVATAIVGIDLEDSNVRDIVRNLLGHIGLGE